MRRKESSTASASVRIISVLASPGTPSSRLRPPARKVTSSSSIARSWPTITRATSRRSDSSRASRAATSDSPSVGVAAVVIRSRPSRRRVHDDVDAELRVVLGEKALVAEIVVPLAPVILVAVEDGEPPVQDHALQVVVYQIVAPAVQLERGVRRSIREGEERSVELVLFGQLDERRRSEQRGDLRLERLREQPVDVVVAVVHEDESAVLHVALEHAPLRSGELHKPVAGEVAERRIEDGGARERNDPFARRDI